MRDHAGVVRDDDQPHPVLALEPHQQVEDLRLDGHVQRGGRLVGDHQRRTAHEGHRDHRPLAEAARELEGVGVDLPRRLGEPDGVERLDGRGPGLAPG